MKALISVLLIVIATVGFTLVARHDPGYILFGYGTWTMEMSLVLFVLLFLLLFVSLNVLLAVSRRIRALPERSRQWRDRKQHNRASASLTDGLVELAEGKWQEAEKKLLRYSSKSDTPLLNYLAAARAAQEMGAYERRDEYLKQAIQAMPAADVAVGLTQADMQLHHGQLEQALASMKHLKQIAPKHTYVGKLLVGIYEQLQDWPNMLQQLTDLKKSRVYSDSQYLDLETRAYRGLLSDNKSTNNSSDILRLWESMPKALREEESMILEFSRRLIDAGEGFHAEPVLRQALERQWRESLVEAYGIIEADTDSQLQRAEKWLAVHGQDAYLLLTLGRLYIRREIWGKARQCLESSVNLGGPSSAYLLLAQLLEDNEEQDKSLYYFKFGMQEFIKEQDELDLTSKTVLNEIHFTRQHEGRKLQTV